MSELTATLDSVLDRVTTSTPRVPGVVAVVTDREHNFYEGAAGERALGSGVAMTTDTLFAIFSTTKALAATACLQLVEDGSLDLDAPAREYAPAIGELQVLDRFDDDGTPRLRAPRRDITTRMLLLHTAGFGYDFFNEQYNRLAKEHGQPSVITCSRASITTPLLFDPGDRWEYGSNIDWAGQVVEGIAGKRLGAVLAERICGPLGMDDTAFELRPDMRERMAAMHQREADGTITAMTDPVLPADPEVHMGGHGLWSTALDYAKFIRMWLNDGMGPDGPVLQRETVEMAVRNHLGDRHEVVMLPGVIPELSHDAEFFPGLRKSWSLPFMRNEEVAPTGRPAGAQGWAGLPNLYYWIDRENGIGGFWATQIFPFADPTSIGGYFDLETTVYQHAQVPASA
jgi:methyl acetate hydrolase